MFKSRIIITPLDSEAVVHLEWNSVEEIAYFRYRDGEKTYDLQGITYEHFAHLCSEAHRLGSWGKALHYWKKEAIEKQAVATAVRKQEFLEVWRTLPDTVKKEWIDWMNDDGHKPQGLERYGSALG
jgi:hypothetical protein